MLIFYVFIFLKRCVVFTPIILIYYHNQALSYAQIQTLGSIYFFSILVFEIPTGIVADLYSHRLSLVLSCLCTLIAHAMIAFGNTFVLYLTANFISGIGYAFFSGCFSALFYETATSLYGQDEYARKYATYYVIRNLGSIIAYITCSVIVSLYSLSLTLFISMALSGVTLLVSIFLPTIKQTDKPHDTKREHSITRFFPLVVDLKNSRRLFAFAVSGLLIGIVVHLALKFTPFHMKTSSVHEAYFGYIETATLLVSLFLVKYLLKKAGAQFNRKRMSIIVQLSILASFIIFSVSFNPLFSVLNVIVLQTLYEIFYSLYEIEFNETISSATRATFLSGVSFFLSLFIVVLFPITGLLADLYGLKCVFIIFSLFTVFILLTFIFQSTRSTKFIWE